MKKILSMVLAAVMCATMMVGCGGCQKTTNESKSSKKYRTNGKSSR